MENLALENSSALVYQILNDERNAKNIINKISTAGLDILLSKCFRVQISSEEDELSLGTVLILDLNFGLNFQL